MKFVVGIDEAGRGPLAGPVAVGVVVTPGNFDWKEILPGVNDSKQLTEKKREEIFKIARRLKAAGQFDYAVSLVSANVIDKLGMVPAINQAIKRALKKIEKRVEKNSAIYRTKKGNSSSSSRSELEQFKWLKKIELKECSVKLDGGLKAPEEFKNQETIIKGDSKEKVIGLASIVAKVSRDRYMVRRSAEPTFAPYEFATHKGYGTKKHREAIAKNGLSSEHRKSYCKNVILL